MATAAKNHGSGHALVVGAARAGAQSRRPLLRPVRQGLRRQQRGAVQAPGRRCCPRARSGTPRTCCARARPPSISASAGAEFGEVVIDPDLAEQHFGEWQGLTYAEIAEKPGNGHLFWLGAAGVPAAGRRELRRPARAHGALDRAADRQVSRPRHRGDGAWRHDPRRAGACLQHASRGGGALRDRQCVDHPDRAFRAGRSGACLEGRLHQLHAARDRGRARRGSRA